MTASMHHYFLKVEHEPEAEWSYEGETGPAHWASLSPKFWLAADGQQQSPIDITSGDVAEGELPRLKFEYQMERINVLNNGHTIEHNEKPGSWLYVGDQSYALEQFHFHVPSEHTIDGRHADMEIHFVHKSETGEVLVLAVLANVGEDQPTIEIPGYADLPKQINEGVESNALLRNPVEFMPVNHDYYTYPGSFTTPPCTEGVTWIVMKSPIIIRPEVLNEFKQAIGRNNRPVQNRNQRKIRVTSQ